MRVVITGGTGMIGRALAAELAERGDQVVITTRSPDRASGFGPEIEIAGWDTREVDSIAAAVNGVDAVVHLVGEGIADGRWTEERRERILDSRVRSTATLVEAIERVENRPSALLQGSAVGYYGDRGDELLPETSEPGAGFLADVCEAWEAASAAVEAVGVRRVVLRTGVVLALEGGALPKMVLPFKLFAGGPVGNGRQWMPWIHIADEVGAIRHLLDDDGAGGPFNLSAPEPATNRHASKVIGRVLGRPAFMPAPAIALKLALGDMSQLLLNSQRVIPEALLASGYSFQFPDIESALADLLR